MLLALDRDFKTARTLPDVPLATLVSIVFPALHWFCKVDAVYVRDDDGKWYQWLPSTK